MTRKPFYTTGPTLPDDAQDRKDIPLFWGLVNYFRDALIAVAKLSMIGNAQHNPGEPLRWNREKGGDELDAQLRHIFEIGGIDWQLVPHSVRNAWRGLAVCQLELEETPWDTPVAEIVKLIRERKEKDAQFDASVKGLCAPMPLIHTGRDDTLPSEAFASHAQAIVIQRFEATAVPGGVTFIRTKCFGPFSNMSAAREYASNKRDQEGGNSTVSIATLINVKF